MNFIPFIWCVSESKNETIKRCTIQVCFNNNCKNTQLFCYSYYTS